MLLWLLHSSAGLLGTVLGLKDKGLVKPGQTGSDSSAWPEDVVQSPQPSSPSAAEGVLLTFIQ